MKILLIMMIVIPSLLFSVSSTYAQAPEQVPEQAPAGEEDFFDAEIEAGLNEAPGVDGAPPTAREGEPVQPSQGNPPGGRFGRNRDQNRNNQAAPRTPEPSAPIPINNRPTTKVDKIEVVGAERKKKKGKLKFADAQPEDITNENFPGLIKSFDYPNADIMDVANAIGKLTGKNFIYEPGVRGKITISAPSQVTIAEAWEAFLSALAMNGFTIVPAGKFLKVQKISSAKDANIETFSGDYYPTSDQLITRIIKLKYIDAEDVKKSLGNLVSKKAGDILAYEKTNSLIISGFGSSIERISRIIEELDKPGFEERLEVVPIKNAKAKDIAELAKKIINKGEDKKKTQFRSSRFSRNTGEKSEALSLVEPDERTNSIIIVGNSQGVTRMKKLVARLDYPLDPADAGGVYVYYVKHGEAKLIAETLSGVAEDTTKAAKKTGSSSSGSKTAGADFTPPKKVKPLFGGNVVIKADENTNSLVITANKQDYKTVANLLAKIDIAKDQVFVEAIIMEMSASNNAFWNLNYMKFFKNENAAAGQDGIARTGFYGGGNIADLLNPTGGKGAILNLGDPSETVSITGPTGAIEIPSLLALVNFLKSKANGNILSTPHILAMDNEEAEIEVGEEVPVANAVTQGVGGVQTSAPQFRDATINLKIKPFISPDTDVVRLNVEQKIAKVSSQPIRAENLAANAQGLTKKMVKTNIVLRDGQTAVLGGLMEDLDTVVDTKVPLLGDIPVLGWLFKSRTVSKEKKNLVIFLTPKIIRNSEDHDSVLKEKLSSRIDWIKKYANGRDPYGERFNSLIKSKASAGPILSPGFEAGAEEEMGMDMNKPIPLGGGLDGDFGGDSYEDESPAPQGAGDGGGFSDDGPFVDGDQEFPPPEDAGDFNDGSEPQPEFVE